MHDGVAPPPLRVAVANDYELVIAGLTAVLEPFDDRVEVVDAIIIGEPVAEPVDIALYDTFGREGLADMVLRSLVDTPGVRRVAVYTLSMTPAMREAAIDSGAVGLISKRLAEWSWSMRWSGWPVGPRHRRRLRVEVGARTASGPDATAG